MEVAHLETIYSASISDLERKSSIADSRLKHTATQAKSTERAVSQAFSFHNLPAANTKLARTTSSVNSLTGAVTPATTSATALSSSVGAIAGISVIATTAVAGLAKGVFDLAQKTAAYGGHLQDLHDQTGIGVENLSVLKLAFDESGGSIDSGATALSRYLRSVSDASTGNDKLRQKFLDVGFTVDDLNAAYGDSDKAIEILVKRVGEHSNSQDRLNALQKIGVRNGAELNGAIIAMRGNLAEFRKEAERLGLVITPEQAQAADDFDDSLNLLTKQIKGMGFSIAHQYLPQISGAISDVSESLAANKNSWSLWGSFINTEIRGVRVAVAGLAGFLSSFSVTGMLGLGVAEGIASAIKKSRQLHLQDSFSVDASVGAGVFRSKGLGVSGGGGGGGKAQQDILQSLKASLIGLNAEFRKHDVELMKSAAHSELAAEKEKLLDNVMSSLKVNTRLAISELEDVDQAIEKAIGSLPKKSQAAARSLVEQSLAQFDVNKKTRIAGELSKEAEDLTRGWRLELDNTRSGADEYTQAIQDLEKAYAKYGQTLDAGTRSEIEAVAAQMRLLKVTRERVTVLGQLRQRVVGGDILRDLGDGSFVFRGDASRDRIATVGEQVLRDREAMRVQQMREVAEDLGFIFSDIFGSIGEGWDSLWDSMLSTARNIANQIASNIFTSLFANLFNVSSPYNSGGIAGLFSGKIAGSRQFGGPVDAGEVYRIHDKEYFRPKIGGDILTQAQMLQQQAPQTREMMRLFIVDDLRKARELGGRDIVRASRQMRKVGKLVPAF